jgi:HTH-type transcriptional regulator / antitoxin HigA
MIELTAIHTEKEYDQALSEVDTLMDAEPGSPEERRLEVLAILVSDYERRVHPIPPPDPIDYLVHVMEMRGLTRKDLIPYIGERGRVTEVLNRRRPLSLRMMRKLHEGLGLEPAVLIQTYDVKRNPHEKAPRRQRTTTRAKFIS